MIRHSDFEFRFSPAIPWAAVILSAAVAVLTFSVTLGGTYIYDDLTVVGSDPRLHDWHLWGQYWTQNYMPGAGPDLSFRPVTGLSFAVQWWLHGDRPWAFHLVNVLLHAAAAGAVAAFTGRLWGRGAAFAAGVLFAVHPVHVEAVAWLVGRAESLCTGATFVALTLCLGGRMTGRRAAAVFGLFAVAVLSKDQGILLPAFVLLLFQLRRRLGGESGPPAGSLGHPAGRGEGKSLRWLAVLLVWGAASYLLYREYILPLAWNRGRLSWVLHPMVRSAGADRWLMPLTLAGRYVLLLVAPARLSIEYGSHVTGWAVRWHEPYVYLGIGAIVVWAAGLGVALFRRSWAAAFCLLAFALCCGMVSNFGVLIPTVMGERLMYMPSAFLLALAAAGIVRLPRRAAVALVFVLAGLGAIRSIAYARLWNDEIVFYEASVAAQPDSVRLYQLLYERYVERDDWAGATRTARACLRRFPADPEGYELVCAASIHAGDLDTAEAMLAGAMARGAGQRVAPLWDGIEARRDALRAGPTTTPTATRPGN